MKIHKSQQRLVRILNSLVECIDTVDDCVLLKDLGICDGSILYIEPKHEEKGPEWSFVKEKFEVEQNTVEIHFNKPGSEEFNFSVSVDQRQPIAVLKRKICEQLEVSESEVRLKRKLLNKEYKEEQKSLLECSLFDGSAVVVEKGKPLKVGQILCKFYLVDGSVENTCGEESFTLVLNDAVINEADDVNQVKQMLKETLGADFVDYNNVRIREKTSCRMSTVLKDGLTVKQSISALRDGHEFVIQRVFADQKEYAKVHLQKEEIILETRKFSPSVMELSNREELVIHRDSSILALRSAIGKPASKFR